MTDTRELLKMISVFLGLVKNFKLPHSVAHRSITISVLTLFIPDFKKVLLTTAEEEGMGRGLNWGIQQTKTVQDSHDP